MGMDYYKILQVNRNASEYDLKKAYKSLTFKWHPDKNLVNTSEAEAKFKEIVNAYAVLSDPQQRNIYDLYREKELKSSQFAPPHSSSVSTPASSSSSRAYRNKNNNSDGSGSRRNGFPPPHPSSASASAPASTSSSRTYGNIINNNSNHRGPRKNGFPPPHPSSASAPASSSSSRTYGNIKNNNSDGSAPRRNGFPPPHPSSALAPAPASTSSSRTLGNIINNNSNGSGPRRNVFPPPHSSYASASAHASSSSHTYGNIKKNNSNGSGPRRNGFPPPHSSSASASALAYSSSNGGGVFGGVPRKAAAIEKVLLCSLEELYKGANKKMKISRTVIDGSRKSRVVQETFTIEVKAGWKKGTKIIYSEKGNMEPGVIRGDVIFVVDEKPHDIYTRDGNDLVINQELTLLEYHRGKTLELTTLDGRNIFIPLTNIVKLGLQKVVLNEGMPISKEPGKNGNLIIKFDFKYHPWLSTTPHQKFD